MEKARAPENQKKNQKGNKRQMKSFKNTEIKGQQFGVRFVPRGDKDDHICIQLLSEDDEQWFETGSYFSSHWLDDLIAVLKKAKEEMKSNAKKDGNYGYKF